MLYASTQRIQSSSTLYTFILRFRSINNTVFYNTPSLALRPWLTHSSTVPKHSSDNLRLRSFHMLCYSVWRIAMATRNKLSNTSPNTPKRQDLPNNCIGSYICIHIIYKWLEIVSSQKKSLYLYNHIFKGWQVIFQTLYRYLAASNWSNSTSFLPSSMRSMSA